MNFLIRIASDINFTKYLTVYGRFLYMKLYLNDEIGTVFLETNNMHTSIILHK